MELTLVLGVLVGAVLGLTGAGGGILAVPALVAGMGWTVQQAAPVALIAVAAGAGLGAIEGLRKGLVRYRAAAVMVLAGVPVTSLGVHAATLLPQRVLLGVFALVMLYVAQRLLRGSSTAFASGAPRPLPWVRIDPESGRFHWSWGTGALFAALGACAGFLTGLLGVGGGFLIVPCLRRLTDVSMHGIVATSLMVIACISLGGIAAAAAHGAVMPPEITFLFALATAAGMLMGRMLMSRVSEATVQRAFALLVGLVACALLLKAAR